MPQDEESGLFEHLPDAIPPLKDFDLRQQLLQWNLSERLKLLRFRVKRRISTEDDERDVIDAFFQDGNVQRLLNLPSEGWVSKDGAVEWKQLRVTITTMAFFDKFFGAGIVGADGALRRCLDEVFDGCTASDLLREMLVNPDSENRDVFLEDGEQDEFLFQLFRALVIGGPMSQSDETIQPYEAATRALYKALVSVKKNAADRTVIDVTSHVYAAQMPSRAPLFPSPSPLHSCFVVVDPKKRWLTVWYHPFIPFW